MASNKQQSRAAAKTPAATTSAPATDPRGAPPPTAAAEDDEVKVRTKARVKDEPDDEMVTVKAPRPFKLTVPGKTEPIDYPTGIYEMPRSHAEHWYAQQFGVEIAE